jgi:hypothetical protein
MLYTFLQDEMDNMCEFHVIDEARDKVERLVEQETIEQQQHYGEQIQLLYMVLQEEEEKLQDRANKEWNDYVNNKPFDDFYKPFCIDCNKEPCLWYQNCKAMRHLDREKVARRGLSNFLNDGKKTHRYPIYRRMALIQWGRYMAQKRHPRCLEDGVRNIAPGPNKAYTGFQG